MRWHVGCRPDVDDTEVDSADVVHPVDALMAVAAATVLAAGNRRPVTERHTPAGHDSQPQNAATHDKYRYRELGSSGCAQRGTVLCVHCRAYRHAACDDADRSPGHTPPPVGTCPCVCACTHQRHDVVAVPA